MKSIKYLLISMILVMSFLSSCNTLFTPKSTPTPVPTLTPSPEPTPEGPKPGNWSGDNISFTVNKDREITAFNATIGAGTNSCEFTSKETLKIEVNDKFAIVQAYDLSTSTDPVSKFLKSVLGEKGNLTAINGQFISPTEASGTFSATYFCGTQIIMGSSNTDWTAKWVSP